MASASGGHYLAEITGSKSLKRTCNEIIFSNFPDPYPASLLKLNPFTFIFNIEKYMLRLFLVKLQTIGPMTFSKSFYINICTKATNRLSKLEVLSKSKCCKENYFVLSWWQLLLPMLTGCFDFFRCIKSV